MIPLPEEFTAESILKMLLSRIPNDVDKREGSIIYDALAPAAWELSAAYAFVKQAYDESFIATAPGLALDRLTSQMGVTRLPASAASKRGTFADSRGAPMDVPIGSRFTSMDGAMSQNYRVAEKLWDGVFRLDAETPGKAANAYEGVLSPITHIDGLGSAVLGETIIPGEDEESDDELRGRYFDYIGGEAQDGNVAQYQKWASQYPGIGRAKVFPLWNGVNTVKVSILDSNNKKATSELVAGFQEYLDPNNEGLGNGKAPIGAAVTVSTAEEVVVNVSAKIALEDGYDMAAAQKNIESALNTLFADTAYQQDKVYAMFVGSAILRAQGVAAASDLLVNGGREDIPLTSEQIGKLGAVTLEAMAL